MLRRCHVSHVDDIVVRPGSDVGLGGRIERRRNQRCMTGDARDRATNRKLWLKSATPTAVRAFSSPELTSLSTSQEYYTT